MFWYQQQHMGWRGKPIRFLRSHEHTLPAMSP